MMLEGRQLSLESPLLTYSPLCTPSSVLYGKDSRLAWHTERTTSHHLPGTARCRWAYVTHILPRINLLPSLCIAVHTA